MVTMTCWYVAECPAKDCTKAAFKRAQVKSIKSAQECREFLRTHLMNSCLHQNVSKAAIDILVDSAEIEAYPFESDEPLKRKREGVELRARSPKRARSSDGRSDGEGGNWRAHIMKAARQCSEMADTLIDLECTLRLIARQM